MRSAALLAIVTTATTVIAISSTAPTARAIPFSDTADEPKRSAPTGTPLDLFHEDAEVARAAAYDLWRENPPLEDVEDLVHEALLERTRDLHQPLIGYLEDQGAAGLPILRTLLRPERWTLESNNDLLVPRRLVSAFLRIGPESWAVRNEILPFLDIRGVSERAALLLASFGDAGILTLVEALADPNVDLVLFHRTGPVVFERLGPSAIRPMLTRLSTRPSLQRAVVYRAIAAAAARMGGGGGASGGARAGGGSDRIADGLDERVVRELLPVLLRDLGERDRSVRQAASKCLSRIDVEVARIATREQFEDLLILGHASEDLLGGLAARREVAASLVTELRDLAWRGTAKRDRILRLLLELGVAPDDLVADFVRRGSGQAWRGDLRHSIRAVAELGEDLPGVREWMLGIHRSEVGEPLPEDTMTFYRGELARAFARIRWRDDTAIVAALRRTLDITNEIVRDKSAAALLSLRPHDTTALACVEERLRDPQTRPSMMSAIGEMPPRFAGLSPFVARRIAAAESASDMRNWLGLVTALGPSAPEVVPELGRRFERTLDKPLLHSLATALAGLGRAGVATLVAGLTDEAPVRREASRDALLESAPSLEGEERGVAARLASRPSDVRRFVAEASRDLTAAHPAWAVVARDLAGDPDESVRFGAIRALGADPSPATVAELIAILEKPEEPLVIQAAAMDALAHIGPAAAGALPQLLARLGRWDPPRTRHIRGTEGSLARALGAIGPIAHEPLVEALEDEAKRLDAIRALGEAGPAAATRARDRLRVFLRHEDDALRRAADRALGQIEFGAPFD